jgi:hypothetical protein
MGDIVDSLLNGDFDFYTGEYIGRGYGVPRTKNKSLAWEVKNFTESKDAAFKGVRHFLRNKGHEGDITPIVNEYIPDPQRSLKQKCLAIQRDFGSFVKWVNARPKTTITNS